MTSAERTIALSGYARQISTELNKLNPLRPWTFVEPTEDVYSMYLRNAGQARIHLQFDSSKGYDLNDRVLVSGHMHLGKNGSFVEVYDRGADGTGWTKVSAPSITVAIARGCAAIAKDIAKRFLPQYLRVFALAQAKVEADAAYDGKIEANLAHLAKVAGETIRVDKYGEVQKSFTFHRGNHYDTVTASADSCSLKLDTLTIAQAEFILKYLKGGK